MKYRLDEVSKSNDSIPYDPENVVILKKPEDIAVADEVLKKIKTWFDEKSREPLVLDQNSKFIRKYIYDQLKKDYPSVHFDTISKSWSEK